MNVVTLPISASKNPAVFARAAKKAGADVVEIRLDLTPNVRPFASPVPILLSPRGKKVPKHFSPAFIDLEMSSPPSPRPALSAERAGHPSPGGRGDRGEGAKLILSHHDYKRTPTTAALQTMVKRMQEQRPWAIKIATNVVSYRDLTTLFDLQAWLKKKRIRFIVLGMGDKAHLSRVLSPYRNALTYASLDGFGSSASGQLPLSFYALTKGRKRPKLLGIFGGPLITASQSPIIHNALFQRHKIDALYSRFPSEEFKKSIRTLERMGVIGFSVTAPFKRDAFLLARKRHVSAESLGVANTLLKGKNGWKAWNTDGEGIEKGYPVLASTRKLAILGAGGAVPSVIRAALRKNAKVKITVFARNTQKAKRMLGEFPVKIEPLHRAGGVSVDTVICAISEDVSVPIPKAKNAIDLRYGKPTRFLLTARKKGIKTFDGSAMLIHQALRQFTHFTGKAPKKDDAEYLASVLKRFLPATR